METNVVVAVIAIGVAAVCYFLNMGSTAFRIIPAHAAEGTHPATPARTEVNKGHFFITIIGILAWTIAVLEIPTFSQFRDFVHGESSSAIATATTSSGNPAQVAGRAKISAPTGFTLDSDNGELKSPATLPAGYTLVVKYENDDAPLEGDQITNGRVLEGEGPSWTVPEKSTNVEVRFWQETSNLVTSWAKVH